MREDKKMGNTVYFVVPCYNEEEVLPETSKRLLVKMKDLVDQGKVSPDSKICFVDEATRNCNPVACPYAKGHYDRINDAIST